MFVDKEKPADIPVLDWPPHFELAGSDKVAAASLPLQILLRDLRLTSSSSEAQRLIQQGGVYVNNQRVSDVDQRLGPDDWKGSGGTDLLLRKGKKDYALIRVPG